jgi:tetratricopeptide (TPR) repeat protein
VLNEGLAEFYSCLKPQGNKAVVGTLLPGRVQTLLATKWLPIEVLAGVNTSSPMYNEGDKSGIFNAQSWLLVHMLSLSMDYRPNFSKFMLALANGQDTAQAFFSVYHKGVQDVAFDLNQYSKSTRFLYAELFNVKLEKSAEDPQVSEVTPLESGLVLADLLALVNKPDEARQAYTELIKENPGNPEVLESQGYLEWQAGHQESARQEFAQAYQAGTKSPQMCFDYAMLTWQANSRPKDAIPMLRRAIELQPDYVDARLQLGLALASTQDYSEAIDQLRQVKHVTPEQAPSYFLALGYSYLATSHSDDARANAEAAKKHAKSTADIDQTDRLFRLLDAAAKKPAVVAVITGPPAAPAPSTASSLDVAPTNDSGPPTLQRRPEAAMDVHESAPRNPFIQKDDQISRVEATAQRLDCAGKSAELHVRVGRASMVFEIPDPEKVLIRHGDEAHHDFSCGAQQPYPITVIYAAKPDPKKGSAGIVRELDF